MLVAGLAVWLGLGLGLGHYTRGSDLGSGVNGGASRILDSKSMSELAIQVNMREDQHSAFCACKKGAFDVMNMS